MAQPKTKEKPTRPWISAKDADPGRAYKMGEDTFFVARSLKGNKIDYRWVKAGKPKRVPSIPAKYRWYGNQRKKSYKGNDGRCYYPRRREIKLAGGKNKWVYRWEAVPRRKKGQTPKQRLAQLHRRSKKKRK